MVACYSIETYTSDVYTHSRQIVDAKNANTETSAEARETGVVISIDAMSENRAVALRSMPLSEAAAATMERMLSDPSTPTHAGESLPTVSAEELLRRLGR